MSTLVSKGLLNKRPTGLWIALTLVVATFSAPAFAALGGSTDSVLDDQHHMNATLKTIEADTYVVQEMRLPYATVVREYVSRSNAMVFAVAWQGPFMPDINWLLGTYSSLYLKAASAQRESQFGRRTLNIHGSSLVLQTAGHMGAFSGRAYDPRLLPSGVSANAIQ